MSTEGEVEGSKRHLGVVPPFARAQVGQLPAQPSAAQPGPPSSDRLEGEACPPSVAQGKAPALEWYSQPSPVHRGPQETEGPAPRGNAAKTRSFESPLRRHADPSPLHPPPPPTCARPLSPPPKAARKCLLAPAFCPASLLHPSVPSCYPPHLTSTPIAQPWLNKEQ